MFQVYVNSEESLGTTRMIPKRLLGQSRWVVACSGVGGPDGGDAPRNVSGHMRVVNYPEWSPAEPVPTSGAGAFHPVFASGSADSAVDETFRFMDYEYAAANGEVVWAQLNPLDGDGRPDIDEGLMVFAEASGTPPAVWYVNVKEDSPVRRVEFRIARGRADEFSSLADAAEVMRSRVSGRREDFVQAAVVPFTPEDAGHMLVGEIHAEFPEGVRVWPMDWAGLADRPDYEAEIEAAAEQVSGWISERSGLRPDDPPPTAVGRVYQFGSCQGGEMRAEHMRAVTADGVTGWWDDPFELDRFRTSVRSYEMV